MSFADSNEEISFQNAMDEKCEAEASKITASAKDCPSKILRPYCKGSFNPKNPLGQFVRQITYESSTKSIGGTKRWKCNFCNKEFSGSGSRVYSHFFQGIENKTGTGVKICDFPKPEIVEELYALVKTKNVKAESAIQSSSTKRGMKRPITEFFERAKRREKRIKFDRSYNLEKIEKTDSALGRFLYANGLPFKLARTATFKEAAKCLTEVGPSYVPPSEHRFRTDILDKEYNKWRIKFAEMKRTWMQYGCSIVMDGWTNIQQYPFINISVSSQTGSFFLCAVDCSGKINDANFQAAELKKAIIEVGVHNVVQVITDATPICKQAGIIIEATHRNVFWTPCCANALNNTLKDVGKISWVKELINDAREIQMFICNHHQTKDIFREHSKNKRFPKPTEVRYASYFIMLERMLEIEEPLQTMAVSRKWNELEEANTIQGKHIKQKILKEPLWIEIKRLVKIIQPIVQFMNYAKSDAPVLGDILEINRRMLKEIRKRVEEFDKNPYFYEEILKPILVKRWGKVSSPLHMAAYAVNPKWYAPMHRDNIPFYPEFDNEVKEGLLEYVARLFSTEEAATVRKEWLSFVKMNAQAFKSESASYDLSTLAQEDPVGWWSLYGDGTPSLQKLAFRLLSQVASSSACERYWSTNSSIHKAKSNNLNPERAEKLIAVCNMIRLEERAMTEYKQIPSLGWDVDPLEGDQLLGYEDELEHQADLVNVPTAMEEDYNETVHEGEEEFYLLSDVEGQVV